MKNILAIDIGTTSVKALIMTEEGKVAAEASASHRLYSPFPGWAEEKPAEWVADVTATVQELKAKAAEAFNDIAVIGVCGMVPAIVLLGDDGIPLRNSIQQNDARCVAQIERLKESVDQKQLFERTGGFTNQQHILPRLLWVKENEPTLWENVRHIMGSYDYVNYLLTGDLSLEKNWAVESGVWDVRENCWIDEMLDSFGIPRVWLPEVHEPGEVIGTTGTEISRSIGLPDGIPVIAGSADHVAATLACGIVDEDDLLIKFGGSADILYCTDRVEFDECLFFDVHDVPGKYLPNGCSASGGSLVKWYTNDILGGASSFAELDAEAEKVPAGSDGLIVLPYFLGEKTPIFDPEAKGVFFGLTLSHTRAHIYRAILESIIFGFRHHLDVLKEKDFEPVRIFAADGGAKSPLWCQIAADILGRPVYAFQDGTGSAFGTALLAGHSVGIIEDWTEIKALLPEPAEYMPEPENIEAYDKQYDVYRKLYENTKALMHCL